VVHFCGLLASGPGREGRFLPESEAAVAATMAAVVRATAPGYGYGSLAAGGDILWAETLLAHGCEVHVVLPFGIEEFVQESVAPAGAGWIGRFHACLSAASAVTCATTDAYLGDDVLFAYCAEIAMDLALLRGRYLDAEVSQLALWDGVDFGGRAGTAADLRTWQSGGRPVTIVHPDGSLGASHGASPLAGDRSSRPAPQPHSGRILRAMLFADVRGFSVLGDRQLSAFTEHVLAALARVLTIHGDSIEYRNTWGDALYVVLADASSAAACALALQDAMAELDFEAAGLPAHLALRLSGHVGPVIPIIDPILERPSFMGSHVSRTARIEPVTPPGAVYVTEAFASELELAGSPEFACDYVGHLPAAKDYGRLRMYRLRRRRASGH
jgi:class 3 adenylate cyclase